MGETWAVAATDETGPAGQNTTVPGTPPPAGPPVDPVPRAPARMPRWLPRAMVLALALIAVFQLGSWASPAHRAADQRADRVLPGARRGTRGELDGRAWSAAGTRHVPRLRERPGRGGGVRHAARLGARGADHQDRRGLPAVPRLADQLDQRPLPHRTAARRHPGEPAAVRLAAHLRPEQRHRRAGRVRPGARRAVPAADHRPVLLLLRRRRARLRRTICSVLPPPGSPRCCAPGRSP